MRRAARSGSRCTCSHCTYRMNGFVVRDGNGRARTDAYIAGEGADVSVDIFRRGLCLPSDNKMTEREQERIVEAVKECFA